VLPLLHLLAPYVVWLYPIGVFVLLIYLRAWLQASRDLRGSLFSLEREMALARMRRAAVGAFTCFGLLAALFFARLYLGQMNISEIIRPTPTPDFVPTSLFAPTPAPGTPTTPEPATTPSPTPTRRPTARPVTLVPSPTPAPLPTETPSLPPPHCPDPGIQITQPGQGAKVHGRVDIRGTANIANFQFYKIELGLGEHPSRWATISDVRRSPVIDGLLEVWDTSDLPAGSYSLRLVVVDVSGNYPPPCEVQIYVTR
jgi:hypothetical protein